MEQVRPNKGPAWPACNRPPVPAALSCAPFLFLFHSLSPATAMHVHSGTNSCAPAPAPSASQAVDCCAPAAAAPRPAFAMLWDTSYTTCMSRSSGVAWKILAKACRHKKVMLLRFTHA